MHNIDKERGKRHIDIELTNWHIFFKGQLNMTLVIIVIACI